MTIFKNGVDMHDPVEDMFSLTPQVIFSVYQTFPQSFLQSSTFEIFLKGVVFYQISQYEWPRQHEIQFHYIRRKNSVKTHIMDSSTIKILRLLIIILKNVTLLSEGLGWGSRWQKHCLQDLEFGLYWIIFH